MTAPVEKFSYWMRFTPEEYTEGLQRCCIEMGLNADGTDEELQARIDARLAEMDASIGRRFDEAFPKTPGQLPGHPLVQSKES